MRERKKLPVAWLIILLESLVIVVIAIVLVAWLLTNSPNDDPKARAAAVSLGPPGYSQTKILDRAVVLSADNSETAPARLVTVQDLERFCGPTMQFTRTVEAVAQLGVAGEVTTLQLRLDRGGKRERIYQARTVETDYGYFSYVTVEFDSPFHEEYHYYYETVAQPDELLWYDQEHQMLLSEHNLRMLWMLCEMPFRQLSPLEALRVQDGYENLEFYRSINGEPLEKVTSAEMLGMVGYERTEAMVPRFE